MGALLLDPLRQLDDDSRRPAEVAEPIAVLVALHRADEFSAACSQTGNDGVDVVDGECDVADAQGVSRSTPRVPDRSSTASVIRGDCTATLPATARS